MSLSSLYLEAFLAVARHRSFTKAAAALRLTQSALSQRIAALEADLETTLFVRAKKSIELTEIGFHLLRHSQIRESLDSEFLSLVRSKNQNELTEIIVFLMILNCEL